MRWYKKLTAVCLSVVMGTVLSACGEQPDQTAKGLTVEREVTVCVWYTDARYTLYLEQAANRFHQANEMVTIKPVLTAADQYLEHIYEQSVRGEQAPDVYLLSSDDLEKACLMGLAAENSTYAGDYTQKKYGSAALKAAGYKEKLYGYPLAFNVPFMVYNKKYMSPVEDFDQLTAFCNRYTVNDENQDLQQIVTWDVSDLLLNYGFSAGSLLFAEDGADGAAAVQVDTARLKNAMHALLGLKEAYGIERSAVAKAETIRRFCEGTLGCTLADAESLRELDASGVDYGILGIPDLAADLPTQTISQTLLAVANPYASDLDVAKAVAHAISDDYADRLNETTGMISARRVSYDKAHRDNYKELYQIYQDSEVKAQFIGAGDIYARFEILLHRVWDGADPDPAVESFIRDISRKE